MVREAAYDPAPIRSDRNPRVNLVAKATILDAARWRASSAAWPARSSSAPRRRRPDAGRHPHPRRAARRGAGRRDRARWRARRSRSASSTSPSTATTSRPIAPQPVVKETHLAAADRRAGRGALRRRALHRPHGARRARRAGRLRPAAGGAARGADRPRPPRAADPGRLRRASKVPTSASEVIKVSFEATDGVEQGPDPGARAGRMTPATDRRWHAEGPAGHRRAFRAGDRARPRHRRVVRRGGRAADQEGADPARQDGRQPLLRGLDPHPLSLRDRREAALGRQRQLLDLGLGAGEGRELRRHGAATSQAMAPDLIVIRHAHPGVPHMLARERSRPGWSTPATARTSTRRRRCSTRFTIRRRKGRLAGLKVAIVGDIEHSRVVRSNIHLLTQAGRQGARSPARAR